jgi:hypothetical protein
MTPQYIELLVLNKNYPTAGAPFWAIGAYLSSKLAPEPHESVPSVFSYS